MKLGKGNTCTDLRYGSGIMGTRVLAIWIGFHRPTLADSCIHRAPHTAELRSWQSKEYQVMEESFKAMGSIGLKWEDVVLLERGPQETVCLF